MTPPGTRKATLTRRAVMELRAKIECALQGEPRWRLTSSALDILISIREQIAGPVTRLSKRQRDAADGILAKAFSDRPVVFLEGEAITNLAELISHTSETVRVSGFEENVMVRLKPSRKEPIVAVSAGWWRILEEIKQKPHFGLPGDVPAIDLDGIVENEDPDGLPSETQEIGDDDMRLWEMLGTGLGEDC